MLKRYFISYGLLLAALLMTNGPLSAAAGGAYVNESRARLGLKTLSGNDKLAKAALRHAEYLDINRPPGNVNRAISAHAEFSYLRGFTGKDPQQRVLDAGYRHTSVRENVSIGYDNARDAVTGLMGAIYHRLVFLDPTLTEIGEGSEGIAHVFVMGRDDVTEACTETPPEALATAPVDCLGERMRRDYYDNWCSAIPDDAKYVAPFSTACPGDSLLDRNYMDALCQQLPDAALMKGSGRYYQLCSDQRRISASWFESFCKTLPPEAVYPHSGGYYRLCDKTVTVKSEWLQSTCKNLPDEAQYTDSGRYRQPCSQPTKLRVEYLDNLDLQRRQKGPEFILWPADGMSDIPPAFFEEEPDPLPDYGVSGYPLSIQVDPSRHESVQLVSFDLYLAEGDDWQQVSSTRLLDVASDPHKILDSHTFALFPMQRLEWNTEYVAVAELLLDGQSKRLEWGFRTLNLDIPILELAGEKGVFRIAPGAEYALYVKPRVGESKTVASVKTERHPLSEIEVSLIDPNTLRVKATPANCDHIKLTLDGGRQAELFPAGSCAGGR